ncbi:MAG: exopolyphosphatase [Firmicutes bacterium]|jgi:nanoRNase/pAp phosphatase (c-di-AMP/oligoRNAs hydrolase)|nr:exopolyphosphatase [Bacillota bacterium]
MSDKKYRLITRSDFDGLVCGVLLKKLDMIDDIKFVHPKDMQDGLIPVSDNDITTNLPYVEGVHLAFDHHLSEVIRLKGKKDNHIIDPDAPSAARVVYDYYGGDEVFPPLWNEMLRAVDKADSGRFDEEDVVAPDGWEMMNFIMDARTGLGRFKHFRISNYDLMMELIDYCTNHTIEEILDLPDVKERVDLYKKHQEDFRAMIKKNARTIGNVLVVDLRDVELILPGNRFVKYAMYPNTNISIQIMWGLKKQNTVMTVGKSIFNRTSGANIGEIMLDYGGGGHKNAGTCQVDTDKSDEILIQIIEKVKE